jgi:hypothetical protein
MKKKYFAPEMEELKVDEPVVLEDAVISTEKDKACTGEDVEDI